MFKYKLLYNQIKTAIDSGALSPGSKLPTETVFCEQGYSRNTVRQALALLEQEGIIVKRRGSGSIVKPLLDGRGQTGNVALVFTSFTMYIFGDTLKGINDGLQGWATPILYSSEMKLEEEERILRELLEKKPDGVIVHAFNTALPNPNLPLYQALIDSGIPVIFLYSYYEGLTGFFYVENDDRQGMIEAVRYLHTLGRRKFGGVFVTEMRQFHHRFQGYHEECHRLGIPLQSEKILWLSAEALRNPDSLKPQVREFVKGCDAIVCASDWHALLVVETLAEMGVKVPEDVAVISFDNSFLCDFAPVPLTSMDCDPYKMGYTAVEKLKNILSGKKESSVSLPWFLVKRSSC